MTVDCKFGDLGEVEYKADCRVAKAPRNDAKVTEPKTPETREINIIGQTVSEGTAAVELFLEECSAAGVAFVRIIHGKGTGALGRGVQDYLRILPLAKSFRYGETKEGGRGATVVEIG